MAQLTTGAMRAVLKYPYTQTDACSVTWYGSGGVMLVGSFEGPFVGFFAVRATVKGS